MRTRLKQVLQKYSQGVYLGEQVERGPQLDGLRQDLEKVRKTLRWTFYIVLAAVIIVFFITLYLTFYLLDKPQLIAPVFGAMGVSVIGAVAYMRTLWKEQTITELLIAVLPTMKPEAQTALIESMIHRFLK